jgi:hypothetical protein
MTVTSWKPVRKWWAALSGLLVTLAGSLLTTGAFDAEEKGILAAGLVTLNAVYWTRGEEPIVDPAEEVTP